MSEPAKKCDSSPESYSPKVKPAIITIAETAAERASDSQTYSVKTADNGRYIDGVPMLNWGEWKDNTYCGAIALAAAVVGIPVSYEYLMGVSGLCYRFAMRPNWCPGSALVQNGTVWDDSIYAALGLELYSIPDAEQRDKRVMENLDAGRPVLCMGQIGPPEWGLLTGYAENGRTFFGRSYFDAQKTNPDSPFYSSDNIFHTQNRYRRAVDYPGTYPDCFVKFFDKPCRQKAPVELLTQSLQACLEYFTHGEVNECRFGAAAYQILIDGLLKEEEEYKSFRRNENYHVGVLVDARRSAQVYLEESAVLAGGSAGKKLLETAALYRELCDGILAVVPYNRLSEQFAFNAGPEESWDRDTRVRLAAALREAVSIERSVQTVAKDVLRELVC